ncbi:GH1 family beta-glucosidase [Frigidibacter sp. RF13]|uniref:GH1 family beta-glucosidase n=1 Tax=Frigidibacter sp. RF13 TaxID=2997340 RepID=UPI00226F762C|nr:GH1 family beta-glucosidase [Frigidibacter sp. RF13]MCY1126511.1 GH1 family beta-glucosidase [Frigidibacter sp. RF13]
MSNTPKPALPLEARAAALRFPASFRFGAATSSYQIEGGMDADGKGKSIWDTFTRRPGVISDGSSGDVACDSYHRWPDDIALLREMGLGSYRFSLSWPRIQPGGRGKVNAKGIGYYDRLIDELLRAGIEPFVTLYHWDLPQELQDDGGWYVRETANRFADYAEIAVAALGDRVKSWTTLNEPWTFAWTGHAYGEDAPGFTDGVKGGLTASHHALLAHGLAVPRIRAAAPGADVGIVLDFNVVHPASSAPQDRAAAKRFEGVQNRWYLDAVFKGRYPDDILELCAVDLPDIRPDDNALIAQPLDFLGMNIYRRSVIGTGSELPPLSFTRTNPPGRNSALNWEIWPRCISEALEYVHREYAPGQIFITENGLATPAETPGADGRVFDLERAEYFVDHLEQVSKALDSGVPVKGYFAWTLIDNFEWAYGYASQFGLAYLDRKSLDRRLKYSGEVYGHIARNGR